MKSPAEAIAPLDIESRILVLRGQRVLLDADLAGLYGVQPKRLNEQVRRNFDRFPPDFVFPLELNELRALRSQFATIETGRGHHSKYLPLAFTEHGAIMAASVLNSPRAIEMSVYVVRAFVRLRQILASNAVLARKLADLEKSVATLDAGTRRQFDEVHRAIRALMTPAARKSRPIGFTADLDRST